MRPRPALAVGWGLLGKAIPPLDPLGDFNGRMTGTVGYWNGFALIAAWGFPLGLWVATRSRLAGLLLIYGSTVALLLTFSRGGLVVAAAAVGLWLLLVRERIATLATLAIGGPAGGRRLARRVRASGRLQGRPAAARARPRRAGLRRGGARRGGGRRGHLVVAAPPPGNRLARAL